MIPELNRSIHVYRLACTVYVLSVLDTNILLDLNSNTSFNELQEQTISLGYNKAEVRDSLHLKFLKLAK